ncbi:ABC transporter ATP-binding protein [Labrys monachus]|uniref:Iron(III) transport system ATP-binding protein n=1 Tax=Labrys monachus TaxID=217067 RepID=A0ABU0FDT3_9HYPH|nr:ABC transporter ATP-binding protein [Labrys monachus]MDQ0392768.1 iron(III) transport system ATP-binding protein [Labrys monachus]
MAELVIEGLAKSFGGRQVLSAIDLTVPSGSLLAILGASGSGKTTLLRLICGFEQAEAGSIRIDGRPVAGKGLHEPPERRRIGYVAQEGALFPHLDVAANIVFGLPRRQRAARHRVAELLDMVGLPAGFASRQPHQLSGGEQQRVALARALAPEPRLVLLDEPFSSLDTALRAETREAVAAALAAAGATAVLVTHDQPEALSMADPVAVLRGGRLIQVATPEELYRRPVDAALARFVGEAVLLPGLSDGVSVRCSLGQLTLAAGMPEGPVEVLVRPEQIRLGTAHPVRARVCGVRYFGHDASIRLETADGGTLSVRLSGHAVPKIGEEVALAVEGEVVAYRAAG